MKKSIVSISMIALVFSASVATPSVASAQISVANVQELQVKLISLLEQLLETLRGVGNGNIVKNDNVANQLVFDTNLEKIDMGHYEGWLIVGDQKISTGKFKANGKKNFSIKTDIDTVDKVVVTIEPEGDNDAIPSGVVVLAGDVVDGSADLSFPVDFSDVAGSAILATPTDGADSNEASGVWFLSVPGPEASLELPELPSGWVYEGWAVNSDIPLTTGRFTSGDMADDFDGFSGPEAGPNYPGEDFLENAPEGISFPIDLADGRSKIVISVEPDINGEDPTGAGPAQAKPLATMVAEDQADHQNIILDQNLGSLPSGSANIK